MIKQLLIMTAYFSTLNAFALQINVTINNNTDCDVLMRSAGRDNMSCSSVPDVILSHSVATFKCKTTKGNDIQGFDVLSHGWKHIEFWYNHPHNTSYTNIQEITVDHIHKITLGAASEVGKENMEIYLNKESIMKDTPPIMNVTFNIK